MLEWVTKNAPSGIEVRITVKNGEAKFEVTATSDDGQIIHLSSKPAASELRKLSQMAREAARHCE